MDVVWMRRCSAALRMTRIGYPDAAMYIAELLCFMGRGTVYLSSRRRGELLQLSGYRLYMSKMGGANK